MTTPLSEPSSPSSPSSTGGAPSQAWLLLAGFVIAFIGSACGIGGGLFAVPLLHFVFKRPLRLAVGTSLYLVLIVTATSTVTEMFHAESSLRAELVVLLGMGALVGNQLGYLVSKSIPQMLLRAVFFVVLATAGVRLLGQRPDEVLSTALNAELAYDWPRRAMIVAIGFGGGFLAPLLGVGGGLLMVPALYFLLPEIGYLGARAQSMAVGSINGARSVFFYQREQAIDVRTAAWFAGGALFGAVLGVLFVHQPQWAEHARLTMGVVLVLVALRFGFELVRPSKDDSDAR